MKKGIVTIQLQLERKKIDALIRCAKRCLKLNPDCEIAGEVIRFNKAKRKLVKHLEIRHLGL